MKGRRWIATACAGALLVFPAAAGAAKKKKKAKAPKPVTVERTAATTANGQTLTLTATCPKGTMVTGGGFRAPYTFTPANGHSLDAHVVYESRRAGKRAWAVSVLRADNNPEGDPLGFAALANCRPATLKPKASKKPKGRSAAKRKRKRKRSKPKKLVLTEVSASTAVALGAPASATATCPAGTTAVGGGFAMPTPSVAPPSIAFPTGSFRSGARQWTAGAFPSGLVPPKEFKTLAYCAKKSASERVETVPLAATNPHMLLSSASALAPACPKKRPLAGGGFSTTPTTGPLPLVTESAPAGRRWGAQVSNLEMAAGSFSAFGYCL